MLVTLVLREIKVLDSTMSKMLTIQGRNKPEGSKFDEKFGRYPSHTLPTVLVYLPSYLFIYLLPSYHILYDIL